MSHKLKIMFKVRKKNLWTNCISFIVFVLHWICHMFGMRNQQKFFYSTNLMQTNVSENRNDVCLTQRICITQNMGKIFLCQFVSHLAWINVVFRIRLNTLRPRQNGRHFSDDTFKCIFFNENVWILIKISLKFVPKGRINNIPALVQIMASRRPGDKPLSEPLMVSLPTHICVTRPQWVKHGHIELNQENIYIYFLIFLLQSIPWCFIPVYIKIGHGTGCTTF